MNITKVTTERDDLRAVMPDEDDLQKGLRAPKTARRAEEHASLASEASITKPKAPRSFWGLTQAFLASAQIAAKD